MTRVQFLEQTIHMFNRRNKLMQQTIDAQDRTIVALEIRIVTMERCIRSLLHLADQVGVDVSELEAVFPAITNH
jgi:hypothetical protein